MTKPNTQIKNSLEIIAGIDEEVIYFKNHPSDDTRIPSHLEFRQAIRKINLNLIAGAKAELEKEAYYMENTRRMKKMAREEKESIKYQARRNREADAEVKRRIAQRRVLSNIEEHI